MRGINDQLLINEYGLSRSDFFTINKDGNRITILRRPGVDKLIEETDMEIISLNVDVQLVPGFCVATTTIRARDPKDSLNEVWTCASASPENCFSHNTRYAETSETRAKQRAVLSILGLYKLGIEAVDASADFERNDPDGKYQLKSSTEAKSDKPKANQSLEDAMKKLNEIRKSKK